MRVVVVIAILAGCKSSSEPASPRTTTPNSDYCRGQSQYVPAPTPLGTLTGSRVRPADTFSIVARDPVTGDLGVAVPAPMVRRAMRTDPIYGELLKRLVEPPGLISKENAEKLVRDAR